MKFVKIKNWEKGLVFKDGNYVRMIGAGGHFVSPFSKVFTYGMDMQFTPPVNLNILLQDTEFQEATILIDVKNNEVVLKYENGLFREVLTPGRYVFWKGLINYEFQTVDLNNIEIEASIDKTILLRKEVAPYIRTFIVEPFEKGILYIDGKFKNVLEAGTYNFWKNSTSVAVVKADMRTIQLEIAGQEILTKDKAALRINFQTTYQMTDIVKAIVMNKEFDKQLYVIMQLALREFVGGMTLDELLEKKESVSEFILESAAEKTKSMGIEVRSCGIRDIILPGDMKDILNQVLLAEKKAQANTIMRREETASTRSLLNTAKLMEDNSMLFKLKEMEYVEKIADKINSISLSGGTQVVDQLKQIFMPGK